MKSGLGEGVESVGALVCGAVVAVNACGDVVDSATGAAIAGLRTKDGEALASTECEVLSLAAQMPLERRTNTTISCVVTNARLTKPQATKVAQMAADAYAHAIRPTHTTNDGDTYLWWTATARSRHRWMAGVLGHTRPRAGDSRRAREAPPQRMAFLLLETWRKRCGDWQAPGKAPQSVEFPEEGQRLVPSMKGPPP